MKPIGQTLDNIIRTGLIEQDEHRDKSYQKVKKIIDEYHKTFIESVLENVKLTNASEGKKNSLEEFYTEYICKAKDEKQKKQFEEIQKNLRKEIANSFTKDDRYKTIDKEDLIKKELIAFAKNDEELLLIESIRQL